MLIQSKRKNTWYYFWRFICLAILNLWLISILENWPGIIHKSSNIFFDKQYIHEKFNGYSGSHADYVIQSLINDAGINLILILIFVVIIFAIGGFFKDTILILKRIWLLVKKTCHFVLIICSRNRSL